MISKKSSNIFTKKIPHFIFFDTETNGRTYKQKFTNRQDIIQLAYLVTDKSYNILYEHNFMIKDVAKHIFKDQKLFNIQDIQQGHQWSSVFNILLSDIINIKKQNGNIIAHNISFDQAVLKYSSNKKKINQNDIFFIDEFIKTNGICSMRSTRKYCDVKDKNGRQKFPKLEELHNILFDTNFIQTHDALDDVKLLLKCYKYFIFNHL